ncbi:MAG: DNA recombination protein RmuC [Muribaculaceae bacterium]
MEILYVLIAIAIGLVIGWLFGKSKIGALSVRNELLQNDILAAQKSLEELEAKVEAANSLLASAVAERDKAILERDALSDKCSEQKLNYERLLSEKEKAHADSVAEQEKRHHEALDAMQKRFDETIAKVEAQMKSATDSMLKERQKEFAETSTNNIGQIVVPLRETIDKMKKAMDDSTLRQASMSSAMKENIEHMMRQSEAARKSAEELARVFKHGSKVQGDWGETVLDELLQSQGLTKGIHYDTQATIKDASGSVVKSAEGSMLRPDVILHLDQRREVIIDSKVSLTAFIDYVNAETEEERQRCLKLHLDSLTKHVKELSSKDYSSYIKSPKVKMDYVIMFVPNTGALWTALNAQPDLWRRSMEKNVFIADEQTLFAALRIINLTWTQIAQAQNHERVFELANEMLNRVGQFWKEYEAMGKALKKVSEAYESGRNKITDGGTSINTTANKLIKLGAKQSDKNPLPQLLDLDDIPQIESPVAEVSDSDNSSNSDL